MAAAVPVYLDDNAGSPLRPSARAAMTAALDLTGNPSSVHRFGRAARRVVEDARARVAALVGTTPGGVVFTSSGTEADAQALLGCGRTRAVVSAVEHDAVRAAAARLSRCDVVPVDGKGMVDLAAFERILGANASDTVVSVMLANNETGAIQPVAEIAALAHARGALVHCDAIAAAGRVPCDLAALGADMVSLSSAKLGGPLGVGALVLRPGLDIAPLISGGGQERRRRGGTENIAGISGFGAAAAEALNTMNDQPRLAALRDRLEAGARKLAPDARIYAEGAPRLANTSCLSMPGVSNETQVMALDLAGVAVSAGAACSSGKVGASHVLLAMGVPEAEARTAIRVSFGWRSAESDVEAFLSAWGDLWSRAKVRRMSTQRPIYLDNHATTPLDPRVREAMTPYLTELFGNPHSTNHLYGIEAEAAVDYARERVAAVIGAEAREIIFTLGATELNNLAIKGAAAFQARLESGARRHVITVTTEHKCVVESAKRIEREGFRVTWLGVDREGLIDLDALKAALSDDTLLVSIMAANNEIGALAPLAEIGALCKAHGALFHTDAAQAFGKIPLDVNAMNVDLMSISAHKVYGPKGIGALYVRRRPRVRLEPLIDGGGQERGLRSGTLAAPLCVGFGEAAAIAQAEMAVEAPRLRALRDRLRDGIVSQLDGVILNGPAKAEDRLPNNLNFSFAGVDAGALMADLKGLAVSSGSACSTASVEPSYVLRALGVSDELSRASLRFGIGRFNTEAEIEAAIAQIVAAVTRLRRAAGAFRAAE